MSYVTTKASAQDIEKAHQVIDNLDPVRINEDTVVHFAPGVVRVTTKGETHTFQTLYLESLVFDGSSLDQNSVGGPAFDAGEIGSWK